MSADVERTDEVMERAVITLQGMANRHRMRILAELCSGELTFAAITEAVPAERTAIGHHLRYLLDARLVRRQRRGRNVFYALSGDDVKHLLDQVLGFAARRVRDRSAVDEKPQPRTIADEERRAGISPDTSPTGR